MASSNNMLDMLFIIIIIIVPVILLHPVSCLPAGGSQQMSSQSKLLGEKKPKEFNGFYNCSRMIVIDTNAYWRSGSDFFDINGPVNHPERFRIKEGILFGPDDQLPMWLSFEAVRKKRSARTIDSPSRRHSDNLSGDDVPLAADSESTADKSEDKITFEYLFNGKIWATVEKRLIEIEMTGPRVKSFKFQCRYSTEAWYFECGEEGKRLPLARFVRKSPSPGSFSIAEFLYIPSRNIRSSLPPRFVFDLMTVTFIYSRLFIQ